jgi:hypothetical protein
MARKEIGVLMFNEKTGRLRLVDIIVIGEGEGEELGEKKRQEI